MAREEGKKKREKKKQILKKIKYEGKKVNWKCKVVESMEWGDTEGKKNEQGR
jgi:hypothetical protein